MPSPPVDRQTFVANLRRSGLLDDEELIAVLPTLPDGDRARPLARELVDKGLLTRFQAGLLLAGRTHGFILGQYAILDQVGRGGMGKVFKARHRAMDRVVALKIVAPKLVKTERAQRLFQREVQNAARLLHPNIVTAYDANMLGDRHFLVMEYVDGPNLYQLVTDRGPLPVGLSCEFIRQAALGLQHAWEMGTVHRDIKPSNLLLNSQGTIKILDFGLSCLRENGNQAAKPDSLHHRPNIVMGTPDYMAPEQAKDLSCVDIRTDLYSLGCTWYFLLTGKVPFPGGTPVEKLLRQATDQPAPVEQLRPDIGADVPAILRRLMAKDPADRFQTGTDLAAALAPFAVTESTSWTSTETVPFADPVATPTNSGEEAAEAAPFCFLDAEEECALNGTLSGSQTATSLPTPVSIPNLPLCQPIAVQPRHWQIALACSAALAVGLLGLVAHFVLR